MPFDPTKFYLGVNIGWLNGAYCHDLGRAFKVAWSAVPPPDPRYPPSDPLHDRDFAEVIDAYFAHLHWRQVKVVRMWLYERMEGMTFTGFSFSRPSKGDYFGLDNYSTYFEPRIRIIMEKAQLYGIQIYWCLLDAAGLCEENDPPEWYRPLFKFLVEEARGNFKKDILLPFLITIDPYQEHVFAIDIVNEVDWIWRKKVTLRKNVIGFVEEVFNGIVEYNSFNNTFKCTTSFSNPGDDEWRDFSFLDFYDYHRYFAPDAEDKGIQETNGDLPSWIETKKCIIGEAGHHYGKNPLKIVDEQKQADSSRTLMDQAFIGGYSGVLLWRYAPVGDPHRLLRFSKQDKGASSPAMDVFLNGFKAAAAAVTSSPATSGASNPFEEYERLVWDEVQTFVDSISTPYVP